MVQWGEVTSFLPGELGNKDTLWWDRAKHFTISCCFLLKETSNSSTPSVTKCSQWFPVYLNNGCCSKVCGVSIPAHPTILLLGERLSKMFFHDQAQKKLTKRSKIKLTTVKISVDQMVLVDQAKNSSKAHWLETENLFSSSYFLSWPSCWFFLLFENFKRPPIL